jgi:hypothetical protein
LLLLIKTKIRENLLKKKSIIAITSQAPSLAQLMGKYITKRWGRDEDREAYKVLLQNIQEVGVPKELFFDKVRWI